MKCPPNGPDIYMSCYPCGPVLTTNCTAGTNPWTQMALCSCSVGSTLQVTSFLISDLLQKRRVERVGADIQPYDVGEPQHNVPSTLTCEFGSSGLPLCGNWWYIVMKSGCLLLWRVFVYLECCLQLFTMYVYCCFLSV